MSDNADGTNTSNQDGNNSSGTTSTAGDGFTAITTQADFDKAIGDRVARERGKYSDYSDLKKKAGEFDKLAEANKSDIDKATDRTTKAEAEVATIPAKVADALRAHLVALHEIDTDDADLFLTGSDPELLLKQVTRLLAQKGEQSDDRKKKGNHVPREGQNTSSNHSDPKRDFLRDLTGTD